VTAFSGGPPPPPPPEVCMDGRIILQVRK
jgi:hypothetical protein